MTVRSPSALEFEIGLEPFEDGGWIWFDITSDTPVTLHDAGWYAPAPAPGTANIAVGMPTFNRPDDCVETLARTDIGPVGGQGDRRGHRAGPGPQQAARPPGVRRGRRTAGKPAVDPRPAQPRWFRRLQPGHVRGAEEHRLPADPVHGRRHPHRAGLDPAGAGDEPVRQDADARRWSDAQPAGAVAPARDGRGGRPRRLHVDQRAKHQVRPRLRQISAERPVLRLASCCTAASTSTTTAGGCA